MGDKATIEKLEDQRYAAMMACDIEGLDELLDEHLSYFHSSGSRDSKSSYLQKMRQGVFHYLEVEHPIEEIVVLGDMALVVGRMQGRVIVDGHERALFNAATAVWRKSDRGWRLVSFQPTPLES